MREVQIRQFAASEQCPAEAIRLEAKHFYRRH
jgi:hypothetical protein